jgi:hypothetical protein
MKPEDWVKVLYTYGPFALLVFFMVCGEARARSAVRDTGVNKKLSIPIYAANWVVIFTLMAFALSAWYRLTFDSEFTIRGSLQNLQGAEMITSNDHNLFLSRRYGPGGHFDYELRVITQKHLQDGDEVPFELDLSTPESENIKNYTLPIRADFYSGTFTLSYDRQRGKLMLHEGGRDEELPPGMINAGRHDDAPGSLFTWKVEAQELAQEPVPFKDRLEAPDPIIRRQARQDLAQQHQQQWQFIDSALANPKASYRVKLGVISALSSNKCSDLNNLSPSALMSVIQASADRDPSLRELARGCLVAQASPAVDSALDSALRSSARNAQNTGELARTRMEVLYALGIAADKRYGSRQAQDWGEFDRAVEEFRKAWGLRQLAAVSDKVVFGKALYGWGLALHDRSWIERDIAHQRKPEYVRAAQDKFSEFLNEVQNSGNAGGYPYPVHLKRAEAYVEKPVPQSLQLAE